MGLIGDTIMWSFKLAGYTFLIVVGGAVLLGVAAVVLAVVGAIVA